MISGDFTVNFPISFVSLYRKNARIIKAFKQKIRKFPVVIDMYFFKSPDSLSLLSGVGTYLAPASLYKPILD